MNTFSKIVFPYIYLIGIDYQMYNLVLFGILSVQVQVK